MSKKILPIITALLLALLSDAIVSKLSTIEQARVIGYYFHGSTITTTTLIPATTSTSIVTTTVTTTFTTTTLAGISDLLYVFSPTGMASAGASSFFNGVPNNQLICYDFIAPHDMTNIVSLAMRTGTTAFGASGTWNWSMGIYSSGGSSKLGEGTTTYSTTSSPLTVSTSPFSLTGGTQYRACWCSDADEGTTHNWWATGNSTFTSQIGLAGSYLNYFTYHGGKATNSCTGSAALPATTGVITLPCVALTGFTCMPPEMVAIESGS